MEFRKARQADLTAVAEIYERIHTEQEAGRACVGWARGVYPTAQTAQDALDRDDLFVAVEDGAVVGTAIINQIQTPAYEDGSWEYEAAEHEVMVLHTLVIDPPHSAKGYGRQFMKFYEDYAREQGCVHLRMDTQLINERARRMYQSLGYREIGVVPCVFNGIAGVQLVLLEKKLHL